MDIQYTFDDLFKKPEKKEEPVIGRPNMRIVKCCGNCKVSWFPHANERRGYCRLGQMTLRAVNRDTPNEKWTPYKIHTTMVCNNHKLASLGHSHRAVSKWVDMHFDINGDRI